MQKDSSSPQPVKRPGISRRRLLTAGLAGAGGLILGDSLLWEPYHFMVEEIELSLPKVPPGRELRLVQLSDLHIGQFSSYHQRIAEQTMALRPEIILLTGDYLEQQRNLGEVREFLELLEAPYGIYAVQGNWEYWARLEGENLRRKFAASGITLLLNQRRDLEIRDVPLSIHGLDYPSASDHLLKLRELADPAKVNLLLSHVPAFEHELLGAEFDLVLAGHTHGGQIRLPLLPPLYMPRFSGNFVAGHYRVGPNATPLYITRGIGTSVLPLRLFCRPEITLLRLTSSLAL